MPYKKTAIAKSNVPFSENKPKKNAPQNDFVHIQVLISSYIQGHDGAFS